VTPARGGSLFELLAPWLPHQRWYAAKGRRAARAVPGRRHPPHARPGDAGDAGDGDVAVDVRFVRATTPDGVTVTYQVPLTCRAEPEPAWSTR
jgi:hypothetical protein